MTVMGREQSAIKGCSRPEAVSHGKLPSDGFRLKAEVHQRLLLGRLVADCKSNQQLPGDPGSKHLVVGEHFMFSVKRGLRPPGFLAASRCAINAGQAIKTLG